MMKNRLRKNRILRSICLLLLVGILSMLGGTDVNAASTTGATGTTETQTNINEPGTSETADDLKELNVANNLTITYDNGNGEISGSLKILMTLTAISLAPFMLVMLTSFTRIIIVLHFTRTALNTQTAPPNNVLIALALFLTFFIMSPIMTEINDNAIKPFDAGEITQEEAIETGLAPLREFMYKEAKVKDVSMFMEIANTTWDGTLEAIPTSV